MKIPHNWQFYPLHLFANPAQAIAHGMARPSENPQGVLMDPSAFKKLPKAMSPAVADHIARQTPRGGCCGD